MSYAIRNPELWESGAMKIEWVRKHMPLLAGLEKEFIETKPFKGSPGRMGAFVGWKIVCHFMENNPKISFQEMMNMTDMNEMLKKSGYKPQK